MSNSRLIEIVTKTAETVWCQLEGRNLPIRYWLQGEPVQNFGDFLTEFFLDRLFMPYGMAGKVFHIIGSCIDDLFFEPALKGVDNDLGLDSQRVVFWGCGTRSPAGLTEENRRRTEILAVRGPLTRSALRLGESIPMGDPSLLMPALYKPTELPATGAVIVPHFSDTRSDAELLELSGCTSVLRPNLSNNRNNLLVFVDHLVASKFVLASSLHAAIVAAAYNKPFAFWDSGNIDLPFKWKDFSELVSIPCGFVRSFKEASEFYLSEIAESYRHPQLWPFLTSAPFAIHPDALLKVLDYDLKIHKTKDYAGAISKSLRQLKQTQNRSKGFRDYSGRTSPSTIRSLRSTIAKKQTEICRLGELADIRERELESVRGELRARETDIGGLQERIADLEHETRHLNSQVSAQQNELGGLRIQLSDQTSELNQIIAERDELKKMLDRQILETLRLEAALRRDREEVLVVQQSRIWRSGIFLKRIRKGLPLLPGILGYLCNLQTLNPLRLVHKGSKLLKDVFFITTSGVLDALFENDWYLQKNPDVGKAGRNPLAHYLWHGGYEGRDPHPLFDSDWYLRQNPDVAASGQNPLVHYVRHGAYEGRDPDPFFDSDWYLQQNPDVAASGQNPLVHYLRHGAYEGRDPSPTFDSEWYRQQNPDVAAKGQNPLAHYIISVAYGSRRTGRFIKPEQHMHGNPGATGRDDNHGHRQDLAKEPSNYFDSKSFDHSIESAAKRQIAPTILFIDSIYPRPDRDSGSIDTVNYMRIFQALGYQIVFGADAEMNPPNNVRKQLIAENIQCLHAGNHPSIDSFIDQQGELLAAAVLSRVYCGGRYYEKIRAKSPEIRIIFNTVDLHGIREEREARLQNNLRAVNLALATSERERYLTRQCDATIVVSKHEWQWLHTEVPGARVVHLPLMRDCPGRTNDFEQREGVCFVGNYQHKPNLDAVTYFLDRIWPEVHNRLPHCKFYVIGSDLPDEVARGRPRNVEVVGHVPDLSNWLGRMRLSVAPLRYGAGAKGKVVTSLTNGLPCVATAVAAEGMNLVNGKHIAIETSPTAFADRIVQLYNDKGTWTRLSDEGCRFCAQEFSLNTGRERLAALFDLLGLPVSLETQNLDSAPRLTLV